MADAATGGNGGLPGAQRGPAQPLPAQDGTTPAKGDAPPPPDLADDTDGDVPEDERQKLPQSSEDAFGEPEQG